MSEEFSRTEMLLGQDAMTKLAKSRVAVFGIGGVGGYVVEALVRSGIGALDLIDNDEVAPSNINRQIVATHNTLGKPKVEAAKERISEINPDCKVNIYQTFYTPETADQFDFNKYDYIVDAIDTVTGKLELIKQAKAADVPIICSMGAGNKLDPTKFEVADISKTTVCPLARAIRTELKKRRIKNVTVVYSKEPPISPKQIQIQNGKQIPGSISFVPSVTGLIIAGEVIKDLTKDY